MKITKLVLVGGFLGAGKTTLLWECARRFTRDGVKVGLITNDQAPNLVDTALLTQSGADIQEVSGSCFCCDFDGFAQAAAQLAAQGAEIIVAEPVGSCTDLSATIMQPLKELHPEFVLAPLTVLADPRRVFEALLLRESTMHPDALYICRMQLGEADRILVNKCDLLDDAERGEVLNAIAKAFPDIPATCASAAMGEGLDTWLAGMLESKAAGLRIADVDYERYAHGEAVLGWLNAVAELDWKTGADAPAYLRALLEGFNKALGALPAEIGHLKVLLESEGAQYAGNLTSLGGDILVRALDAKRSEPIPSNLTINARVQCSPDRLEEIVRAVLSSTWTGIVNARICGLRSLKPGRPQPTHRHRAVR